MKNIFILISAVLVILSFTKCTPKESFYIYENQENIQGKSEDIPFNPNDFELKLELGTDSVILDKEKTAAISIKLFFIGQYQYYPPNLNFEVYINNKKITLSDTIKYHITTVIDDHVTYFKDSANTLNIPELITKLKKEKNLPADLNYFSVISVYPRYYIGNKTNPDSIQIKVKLFWDNGNSITEKNYILKKVEYKKEEYHLPIRPFG
jgi:hypothetical protein